MSQHYRLLVVGALIASVVPALPASASKPDTGRGAARRTSEIVVKYADLSDGRSVRAGIDAKLVERVPTAAIEVIDPAGSIGSAIAELEAEPNVVFAEPNYLYEASGVTPNDPHYGSLWALDRIAMPAAWGAGTGNGNVTVAVVDSGIALRHPDLAPNIWTNRGESGDGKDRNGIDDDGNGYVDDWRGWDWVDKDNNPGDAHGHGSHVAGTIGARGNDAFGVAGVNWDVSLVPLRGLDHTGVGTSADIAAAFHYAGKQGIDVVNASLGGAGQSVAILEAISAYPDTLFVVAAGNEGSNNDIQPQYPCSYRIANLVCVAASDKDDNLAGFSNYGAVSVDIAAPGVGIVSTAPALSTVFSETFESDLAGRWTTGGTNNLWNRAIDLEGGFLADSPRIDYLPGTDAWAATDQAFSLSGQEDCKLTYALNLATEAGKDVLLIEASRDGQTWSRVEGWTGASDGWDEMTESLQAFDGSSRVFLRFRLRSDASVNGPGADIDDLRVHCSTQSYSGEEFRSASGTSMAAPHVAGVAALLKASSPGASPSQIIAALLSGADTDPALTGKVASSGRLNAAGALEALTGHAIEEQPGPAPEPVLRNEHERVVTLRLVRSLQARGRIRVPTDQPACAEGVPVVIKRNGAKIARTRTDQDGSYRVRLRDRRGRYHAVAPQVETAGVPRELCLETRSQTVRN